jgi:hypothetical protein
MILVLLNWLGKVFGAIILFCDRYRKPGKDQLQHTAHALPIQVAICGRYTLLNKVVGNEQPHPIKRGPSSHQLRKDRLAVSLFLDHPLQASDLALDPL